MKSYLRKVGYIATVDANKNPNGHLWTLVNIHEGDKPIEQVYITVCRPGDVKGPHMHEGEKEDRFFCIGGRAAIICRHEETGEITEHILDANNHNVLVIPPYNSHAIVALDGDFATILSMPNEGYCPGKPYNQIETIYGGYNWNKWFID